MAWRAGLWRGSANSGVMPTVGPADHAAGLDRRATPDQLPIWRIGIISGLVGMLCCVGPTILALVGIISAATAFAWANDLYDNYAWWFRVSGLAVLAILVWWALRHRNRCSRQRNPPVTVAADGSAGNSGWYLRCLVRCDDVVRYVRIVAVLDERGRRRRVQHDFGVVGAYCPASVPQ